MITVFHASSWSPYSDDLFYVWSFVPTSLMNVLFRVSKHSAITNIETKQFYYILARGSTPAMTRVQIN